MRFPGWSLRTCWSAPIALTLLLCVERSARAEGRESTADEAAKASQEQAEALYKEGALLLREGRYWEAEARFQESLKLLKGRGTLLNLALCHENLGKLATAWHELKTLEEQASAAGDTTRLEVAKEHLAWIEPQLSHLSVTLSAEAQLPGIQVELDGQPVTQFGVRVPVDPGNHQLRANAPGKKDWSVDLVVQIGDQARSVMIPSLADIDVVPSLPAALPIPQQAKVPTAARPPEPPPKADYTAVYITGAATVTLTVGAVISAFLYYDRRAAYHDAISDPASFSDEELVARHDSAKTMGWVNGSLIALAGAGAATTGILWYRASRANSVHVADGAWVAPSVVGSGAGLRAGASF